MSESYPPSLLAAPAEGVVPLDPGLPGYGGVCSVYEGDGGQLSASKEVS